jgi:membrane protein
MLLVGSEGMRLLVGTRVLAPGTGIPRFLQALFNAAPTAALLLFVFFTYLVIPSARPRPKTAAMAAILCVVAYLGFASLMQVFVDYARYSLLYGVFGRLIILLVKVFTFFTLYFYGCELAYVHDHFDALLFARFYRVARTPVTGRIERALFIEPIRLLRAYARAYPAGALVFGAGERGRTVYYLYDGEIGVYLGEEGSRRRVASLGPGEIFGEMAHILDEPRTATTRAEVDSVLFELPPAVFDLFLRADVEAMRRLADSLSSRLKEANLRMAEIDLASKGRGDGQAGKTGDAEAEEITEEDLI